MQPVREMQPLFSNRKTEGMGGGGGVNLVWAEKINAFLIFFLQLVPGSSPLTFLKAWQVL